MVLDVPHVVRGTLGMLLYALRPCLHQQQHNQGGCCFAACIELDFAVTTLGIARLSRAAQLMDDNV